jgi:nicotinate-nucleotide pyrophosphorylase
MKPRAMTVYEGVGTSISEAETNSLAIPIEVRNETALREALVAGEESLLLDNTTVQEARRAIRASCVVESPDGLRSRMPAPMH